MGNDNKAIDFSTCVLGETRDKHSIDTCDENRRAALHMAEQAKHTLRITSRNLDSALYDTDDFLAAVKALALRGRRAHVYILINSADTAVKNGHRLVNLCQRLSSFIDIQVQSEHYNDYNEAVLIADDCGYIRRRLADRYEAEAEFNAPRVVKELIKQFDEMWNESNTDPNLGRLHI